MTITQADIITILKTGTYPTSQKPLTYYQQPQKFRIYPYVEVSKVQSDSNTTDIEKTTLDQTFEIRYYVKYTRPEEYEEADRLATENEILNKLENNDFIPTGIIYFESKQWSTNLIDDEIYGSRSVLRFTIKDMSATGGVGVIGSLDKFEINSDTTPIQVQILNMDQRMGASITQHTTDDEIIQYDPSGLIKYGEFTITYKNTTTIESAIDALSEGRIASKGKIIRAGTPTNYMLMVGPTTTSGSYGDVERATTVFYAVGTW